MTPSFRIYLSVLLISLASAQLGIAANNREFQYEDTFDEFGAEWGEPNELFFVQDGAMVLDLQPGWYAGFLNQGVLVEDGEVSLRTRQVAGKDTTYAAGLVFWAESPDNFYIFAISRDGGLTVMRHVGEKVLVPVSWRQSEALKQGIDEWNELRVVITGSRAAFYINGAEVVTMNGQAPTGGSFIGLYGYAPSEEGVTYEFDDLRVK
jgi:hypothetical protein